jgi:sodium/proline symporter
MVTLTFIVYLAVMLGIGIIAYRRTQDLSDYVLGGRNLGPIPSALSAGYGAFWLAGGLLIGTWANWLLVAQRLRVYSQRAGDALTLPAFFEKRFEDKSHTLRVVSAIFVLVFFLFYTSSGLVAGGKLFETVFGLDYQLAVVLGAVAVISYTMFGGFLAVSWTDVVQGLLMVGAMVLVPVIALSEMGGISATFDKIANSNPELLDAFTNADGTPITLIGTLSLIGWGFGYFGQPHILARFKGIKSKDHVPAARRIAVAWTGVAMIGSMAIGLFAVAYLKTGLGDNETVFMVMVDAIFHPLVAGVLLAAILAAIMSTADSQLLVSSSALAEDFYKALFHKDASSEQLVKVGRFAVVGIAVIATVLALNPESGVLDLVSYAWAGFGAAFGPALILSLYWKRMTRQGALAGIIVGGITVVVWKQLEGGWFDLYEIIPGILLATLAVVVASMATREPEDSIQQKFDDVVTEVRS